MCIRDRGILDDNDSDPEGDNQFLQTTPATLLSNGQVTINIDGSFIYTPNLNYVGPDQFRYVVCDDGSPVACDTATVYLTVLPAQDPPIAKDDINITLVNTPVTGQVLVNDKDPDGDNLVVNVMPLVNPQNGMVTIDANGQYSYTPNTDFSGEDTFTYIVCDDVAPIQCDTAVVTINIIDSSNPTNNPPIANNDINFGTINNSISGDLSINDFDPDGQPFTTTTTPLNGPTNGTITIAPNGDYIYVPFNDFVGIDEVQYEICDIFTPRACDTAILQITILPFVENLVFANDDHAIGEEDTPITGTLLDNDFDPEGDEIIININPVSLPNHGTVIILSLIHI